MRGIDTQVRRTRRRIFKEVADLAYHSDNLIDDVEALPYKIVDYDESQYQNIYRERAIVRERIRLAMGLSLRPENRPVHLTQGLEESNISEKYYEPPLMQVIPSACNACPENRSTSDIDRMESTILRDMMRKSTAFWGICTSVMWLLSL